MYFDLFIGAPKYSYGIDIWSVGCILGELLLGRPLFRGTSTLNQLALILELTGQPTDDDIEGLESPFAATMLETLPITPPNALTDMFPGASAAALDLVRCCLTFNPKNRITAEEALHHPFVNEFHNSEDEPICAYQVKLKLDDNRKLVCEEYREALYKEMAIHNRKRDKSDHVLTG